MRCKYAAAASFLSAQLEGWVEANSHRSIKVVKLPAGVGKAEKQYGSPNGSITLFAKLATRALMHAFHPVAPMPRLENCSSRLVEEAEWAVLGK